MLDVKGLRISVRDGDEAKEIVHDLSFTIQDGQWVCLVGESGAGKSLTALSLTGLLPKGHVSGKVEWSEEGGAAVDLLKLPEEKLRKIRGKTIAYIFQDPHTTLNPVLTIGAQMMECYRAHYRCKESEAQRAALASLAEAHLPEPRRLFDSYPHQLSGGMKQRVMIAMALQLGPRLLVADEPTTALDVTVERGIVDLLKDIRTEWPFSLLFITHNLYLASLLADKIIVLRHGALVEVMDKKDNAFVPTQAYTRALFNATLQSVTPKTEILLDA